MNRSLDSRPLLTPRRALCLTGLWMSAGAAGALLAFVGIATLALGRSDALVSVALLAFGIALAALAWRRGNATLERLEPPLAAE